MKIASQCPVDLFSTWGLKIGKNSDAREGKKKGKAQVTGSVTVKRKLLIRGQGGKRKHGP